MKATFRFGGIIALTFLFVGFSYTLDVERTVIVSGDVGLSLEALQKEVAESGGKLVYAQDGKTHWYVINGVSLSFVPQSTDKSIKAEGSIFMGSGCVGRGKAAARANALLEQVVGRAVQRSAIPMHLKPESVVK